MSDETKIEMSDKLWREYIDVICPDCGIIRILKRGEKDHGCFMCWMFTVTPQTLFIASEKRGQMISGRDY